MNAEQQRLSEMKRSQMAWHKWGPYLSERQWGTVREDYSPGGTAWDYLPHDHARSRAYRWGEDGIAGVSDDQQRMCLSLALWNERDPILKERLFGLTGPEGNHGEDVKEYYFYVDSTPPTVTLLTPPLSLSTPAVFRMWDEMGGPTSDGPNDLEPAALRVEPRLDEWRNRLADLTGQTPILTGSGSTWFVHGSYSGPGLVQTRTDRPGGRSG